MNGVRLALFASLALNVLLVGVVGGAAIAGWRHERAAREAAPAPNMGAVLGALPPERSREVRGRVVEAWRDAREERMAARRARIEVARIVGGENYDAEAARRAFAAMRTADAAMAAHFHDAMADTLATMTTAERRAVLRELMRRRAQAALRLAPREGEALEAP